jgi:hypothetical protein
MPRRIEIVVAREGHRFTGVRDPDGQWWHRIGPPTDDLRESAVVEVLTFEEPNDDPTDHP